MLIGFTSISLLRVSSNLNRDRYQMPSSVGNYSQGCMNSKEAKEKKLCSDFQNDC